MGNQKKYYFIYKTINLLNGRFYIGQHFTINLNDGYYGSGNIIKQSIKKHGKKFFKFEILEFCTKVNINEREIFWIKELNATNPGIGYNLTDKPYYEYLRGENHPFYGKIISEESKKKMSISQKKWKRKPMKEETKIKISKSNKGKKRSDLFKQKLGLRSLNKFVSDSTRLKISKALTGKKRSEESKINYSKASKGRIVSQETKDKQSIIQTGKIRSQEFKDKCSIRLKGEGNPMFGKKHKEESKLNMSIHKKGSIPPNRKVVLQIDINNGNIINEFISVKEASLYINIDKNNISSACLGKQLSSSGFIWIYKINYTEDRVNELIVRNSNKNRNQYSK